VLEEFVAGFENSVGRAREARDSQFGQIVGSSAVLETVLEQVERVGPTDATVLILGETGTGKELIAQAVHNTSSRCNRRFVRVNCAAIPLDLLESELFGHEKGAFTGAITQRIGRFEMAHQGTLFLDEVGDIPLVLQPKLLRVLQEQDFERLGSSQTYKVDVRVIAATHRKLEELSERNEFRTDLYYRLNVFPIVVPPLRERREDIPALVTHFVKSYSRRIGKQVEEVPAPTMAALTSYSWPGNIRELQNVIERAVILSTGPMLNIDAADLKSPKVSRPPEVVAVNSNTHGALRHILEETEREQILKALAMSQGVVAGKNGAALRLGMKQSTLRLRMQKLGISRHFTNSQ
jgi:formate hydrogenlyase transcriptional activator